MLVMHPVSEAGLSLPQAAAQMVERFSEVTHDLDPQVRIYPGGAQAKIKVKESTFSLHARYAGASMVDMRLVATMYGNVDNGDGLVDRVLEHFVFVDVPQIAPAGYIHKGVECYGGMALRFVGATKDLHVITREGEKVYPSPYDRLNSYVLTCT